MSRRPPQGTQGMIPFKNWKSKEEEIQKKMITAHKKKSAEKKDKDSTKRVLHESDTVILRCVENGSVENIDLSSDMPETKALLNHSVGDKVTLLYANCCKYTYMIQSAFNTAKAEEMTDYSPEAFVNYGDIVLLKNIEKERKIYVFANEFCLNQDCPGDIMVNLCLYQNVGSIFAILEKPNASLYEIVSIIKKSKVNVKQDQIKQKAKADKIRMEMIKKDQRWRKNAVEDGDIAVLYRLNTKKPSTSAIPINHAGKDGKIEKAVYHRNVGETVEVTFSNNEKQRYLLKGVLKKKPSTGVRATIGDTIILRCRKTGKITAERIEKAGQMIAGSIVCGCTVGSTIGVLPNLYEIIDINTKY